MTKNRKTTSTASKTVLENTDEPIPNNSITKDTIKDDNIEVKEENNNNADRLNKTLEMIQIESDRIEQKYKQNQKDLDKALYDYTNIIYVHKAPFKHIKRFIHRLGKKFGFNILPPTELPSKIREVKDLMYRVESLTTIPKLRTQINELKKNDKLNRLESESLINKINALEEQIAEIEKLKV